MSIGKILALVGIGLIIFGLVYPVIAVTGPGTQNYYYDDTVSSSTDIVDNNGNKIGETDTQITGVYYDENGNPIEPPSIAQSIIGTFSLLLNGTETKVSSLGLNASWRVSLSSDATLQGIDILFTETFVCYNESGREMWTFTKTIYSATVTGGGYVHKVINFIDEMINQSKVMYDNWYVVHSYQLTITVRYVDSFSNQLSASDSATYRGIPLVYRSPSVTIDPTVNAGSAVDATSTSQSMILIVGFVILGVGIMIMFYEKKQQVYGGPMIVPRY